MALSSLIERSTLLRTIIYSYSYSCPLILLLLLNDIIYDKQGNMDWYFNLFVLKKKGVWLIRLELQIQSFLGRNKSTLSTSNCGEILKLGGSLTY